MKDMKVGAMSCRDAARGALAVGFSLLVALVLMTGVSGAALDNDGTATVAEVAVQHEEAAAGQQEGAAAEEHAEAGAQAVHEGEGEHVEEGEHGATESHGMPWSEVIYRWINFCLLAALMYWVIVVPPPFIQEIFSFPGLKVVMANRSQAILAAKALAEKQQKEAEQILTASANRLEQIEGEVEGLLDQARSDGEREKQQAEKAGQEQADKIRDMAGRELRAETATAQRKLREHVAQLAVGMAEKLLKENLSREDQQRLVNDYISRLGERVV
jgi:F-type H+-transporting ATPase subunit b